MLQHVRQGVLATLRLQASFAQQTAAPASLQLWRGFADSFLDKAAVSDRVLGVVKNFEKVDAGKVSCGRVCWLAAACVIEAAGRMPLQLGG